MIKVPLHSINNVNTCSIVDLLVGGRCVINIGLSWFIEFDVFISYTTLSASKILLSLVMVSPGTTANTSMTAQHSSIFMALHKPGRCCFEMLKGLFKACTSSLKKTFWKKTLWPLLWMGFNCLKATEAIPEDSLLFTTHPTVVPDTHLIDLKRMKGWVDVQATQLFWNQDPWFGNFVP